MAPLACFLSASILFLSLLIVRGDSDNAHSAESSSQSEPNPYELAAQWEKYAKDIEATLDAEKAGNVNLRDNIKLLTSKLADLEKLISSKDFQLSSAIKQVNSKDEELADLQKKLDEALNRLPFMELAEKDFKDISDRAKKAEKAAATIPALKKKLQHVEKKLRESAKALEDAKEDASKKLQELEEVLQASKKEASEKDLLLQQAIESISELKAKLADAEEALLKQANPFSVYTQQIVDALNPTLTKIQEVAGPHAKVAGIKLGNLVEQAKASSQIYLAKAKTVSEPYLLKAKAASQVYLAQAKAASQPYIAQGLEASRKYHRVVEEKVQKGLEAAQVKNITETLVFYTAVGVETIPILLLVLLSLPLIFGVKSTKKVKVSTKRHTRKIRAT